MARFASSRFASSSGTGSFVRDLFIAGTAAGVGTAIVSAALAAKSRQSAYGPINAVSHAVHGNKAVWEDQPSWQYTGLGFALNHAAALVWGAVATGLFRAISRRQLVGSSAGASAATAAALTAGLAFYTDYRLMPRRFTPAWDQRLPRRLLTAMYGTLAAGLAGGIIASQRGAQAAQQAQQQASGEQAGFDTVRDLVKDVKYAMLTTVAEDGRIHSRPMATVDIEQEGEVLFLTSVSSHKASEIGREQRVNIAYSDPGGHRYVSVSGTAQLSHDRERIQRLFKPIHRAWFPLGADDPDLALLCVQVDDAEWWDAPARGVVAAIGMAKAAITRKPYAGEGMDHGRLSGPLH